MFQGAGLKLGQRKRCCDVANKGQINNSVNGKRATYSP